jgi:hypothetical protein
MKAPGGGCVVMKAPGGGCVVMKAPGGGCVVMKGEYYFHPDSTVPFDILTFVTAAEF